MSEKDEGKKYTSGLGEEFDREFDEAYRLAMEMIVEKRGGDRSIIYQKLMDSAPNIGMIVVEREAVYQGEKGTLVWDYGLCNEITFIYGDDPDHIAVLYTAKDEYDAEEAFNRFYNEIEAGRCAGGKDYASERQSRTQYAGSVKPADRFRRETDR